MLMEDINQDWLLALMAKTLSTTEDQLRVSSWKPVLDKHGILSSGYKATVSFSNSQDDLK